MVSRLLACLSFCILAACAGASQTLPDGFVYLRDTAPTIKQDIRYFGANNFVGRRVNGYQAPECVLAKPAAEALARVQDDLARDGLTLKVFDCYRPQRAVDDFVAWSKDPSDPTKAEYYPALKKSSLFPDGYIAERSGHSRGATVDLAIAPVDNADTFERPEFVSCVDATGEKKPSGQLDFGTAFDCFDTLSNTADPRITGAARANRQKLVDAMAAHGFSNYRLEWWHFTFRPEPYPDTYFDFLIE